MNRELDDDRFMRLALELAQQAGVRDEVPVGALVVAGGRVVGRGANAPIGRRDPTAHAEILALREAAEKAGNYRLVGATIYCTVEPCLMCLGAAVHARIDRLVYGADDPKVGSIRALDRLASDGAALNHRFAVTGGVLADESAELIRRFFRDRREQPVGG
ncbi:MAG TPA: tRNA adenosine(34) deaminase TadA [Candidatus Polarisedimenticolaceae bacterium]|nr:tRNA adenosine(34) deaminase TadA [Candidatus Polarisedimenticolaceae bacterium]